MLSSLFSPRDSLTRLTKDWEGSSGARLPSETHSVLDASRYWKFIGSNVEYSLNDFLKGLGPMTNTGSQLSPKSLLLAPSTAGSPMWWSAWICEIQMHFSERKISLVPA